MESLDTIKELVSKINKAEVISFDIFDTLIHRRVIAPTDVFEMVKRYIVSKHKELYYENESFINNFPRVRVEAETRARELFYARFRHHEILLDDIYEIIFSTYPIPLEHLNIVKQIEIECELFSFYANKDVKGLFDYALENNKKVVLTTDMYLPTPILNKILESCGYKNYHAIFCSGELKLSKSKGDIYPHLSKVLNVPTSKVLHIGDNFHSDYEMAKKKGVNAFYLDYKYEGHNGNKYKNRNYGEHNNFRHYTDSVIEATIVKLSIEHKKESELFKLGYSVFGPLFTGYFLWLINNLKSKKVDKILFFARDAYLLRELYVKHAHKFGITIPEEYVYISRASSLLSSYTDYNIERLWHLFSGRTEKPLRDKLRKIGLDVETLKSEILRIGFDDLDTKVTFNSDKVHSLLIRLPKEIQQLAKEKRKIVSEYFKTIIGDNEKLAIVDIGWTGNMQGGFSRVAKLLNPKLTIDGYYLGTSGSVQKINQLQGNTYSGYLAHNGNPVHVYNNILSPGGIELLEFAFVAPHGTTLDYKLTEENKIVPVLERNSTDESYYEKSSELQKGALAFVDEILPMILKIGIEHFLKINWVQPFFNLAYSPTPKDALLFGSLTHSDSATDTQTRLPLAAKLSRKLERSSPEYQAAYEKAIWKKGFEVLNAVD